MLSQMRLCEKNHTSTPQPTENSSVLKHVVLEAMASILVTYSAAYVPDSETDYLKQYVSSICVFAIIMTMKDSDYFFPDGTPMTTIMLYSATLYTDAAGNTNWKDILGRFAGQLIGFVIVTFICAQNQDLVANYSILSSSYRGSAFTHAVNEGVGTMIESIAIAYATIPLTSPYEKEDGLQSKAEAFPPDNASLWVVALSLSSIHYTLERLFQGSMNPLITVMQHYLKNSLSDAVSPVVCQCVGLFVAALYIQWCVPSKETLSKLRKKR